MWFRRDLRLQDNPALLAAAGAGPGGLASRPFLPLYILAPDLASRAGEPRLAHLAASLRSLAETLGGIAVRTGDPGLVLAELAGELGPLQVHHAAEFTPRAIARDSAARLALQASGSQLLATGSPYAVAPGRVRKADGTGYQVFTPFHRAWRTHGWRPPAPRPTGLLPVLPPGGGELPNWPTPAGMHLPIAGEAAALDRWETFRTTGLAGYQQRRDRPDLPGTSLLSTALRFGEVHPRTLLADLGAAAAGPDPEVAQGAYEFARELAWREFFADVLARRPDTLTANLNPAFDLMPHDSGPAADAAFQQWATGRTGFPLVDAGMRQLRTEGFMHNRVRMVVASFLVKDLHLPWWRGAGEFMAWLLDGDEASNTHNWQWVAGSGADAAPYFRIFNPVAQGLKFDPEGAYVRRYVPELSHLPGRRAHVPWDQPDGYAKGYPPRMLDHAQEREESLGRYRAQRAGSAAG